MLPGFASSIVGCHQGNSLSLGQACPPGDDYDDNGDYDDVIASGHHLGDGPSS